MTNGHEGRAHSKFSASGAERWLNCPASVELSEGMPDKSSDASLEGTKAHELLEEIMRVMIATGSARVFYPQVKAGIPSEMVFHATNAANFIMGLGKKLAAPVLVETRVYLDFIHEEMFGTFDGAILDHFGVLHVFDFKYGKKLVNPRENMQMIFYALGLAYKHHWNFESVRVWIIQPRVQGYDGPTFWDIPTLTLKKYVDVFTEGVWRVENEKTFAEGDWCYFCRAKTKCPVKTEAKRAKTIDVFSSVPISNNERNQHGLKKESGKKGAGQKESGKESGKESAGQKEDGW